MKSILALVYLFNVSWLPFSSYGMNTEKGYYTMNYENPTSVNFQLGLEVMDLVTVYGGEKTNQLYMGQMSFDSFEQQYYCGIDVHYSFSEALNLSAGLYRQCTHPVQPWEKSSGCFDTCSLDIYLQVSGKIKLF